MNTYGVRIHAHDGSTTVRYLSRSKADRTRRACRAIRAVLPHIPLACLLRAQAHIDTYPRHPLLPLLTQYFLFDQTQESALAVALHDQTHQHPPRSHPLTDATANLRDAIISTLHPAEKLRENLPLADLMHLAAYILRHPEEIHHANG